MTTTTTARRRNPRGEGARLADEIVAGARAIVERTGTDEAVTLRSVAREVGIAAPSIYAHFTDREAILWGLVRLVFEEIRVQAEAAIAAHSDPVERLVTGSDAYVAYGLDNPALYRLLFAREFPIGEVRAALAGVTSVALDDRLPSVGVESFALLVDSIERCVADGRSASTDPFADAVGVWVALHGMVSLWSTVSDFPWPESRYDFVRRLVRPLAQIRQ